MAYGDDDQKYKPNTYLTNLGNIQSVPPGTFSNTTQSTAQSTAPFVGKPPRTSNVQTSPYKPYIEPVFQTSPAMQRAEQAGYTFVRTNPRATDVFGSGLFDLGSYDLSWLPGVLAGLEGIDWQNPATWPDWIPGGGGDEPYVPPDTIELPDGTVVGGGDATSRAAYDPNNPYKSTPGFVDNTTIVTNGGGSTASSSIPPIPSSTSSSSTTDGGYAYPDWDDTPITTPNSDDVIAGQIYEAVLDARASGDGDLAGALEEEYRNYRGEPFPDEQPEIGTTTTIPQRPIPHPAETGYNVGEGDEGFDFNFPDLIYSPDDDTPTDPVVTDPVVTDPVVDPVVTDPVVTDPVVDPVVTDPVVTDPVVTDPVVDPVVTDPDQDPNSTDGTGSGAGSGDGSGDGDGDGDGDGRSFSQNMALASSMGTPSMEQVTVEPPDLAEIGYFYDVGGDSIFAPTQFQNDEEDVQIQPFSPYWDGGLIQENNLQTLPKRASVDYSEVVRKQGLGELLRILGIK